MPERANVTIPNEAADLFRWLVKYDPRFEGSPAAVAAYLIRRGAEVVYAEGLAEAEPLPSEVATQLAARSRTAMAEAVLSPGHRSLAKAG